MRLARDLLRANIARDLKPSQTQSRPPKNEDVHRRSCVNGRVGREENRKCTEMGPPIRALGSVMSLGRLSAVWVAPSDLEL